MPIIRSVIFLLSAMLVGGAIASAQYVPEPNPANKPYVFLGGDKPKKNAPATSRTVKGVVMDETGKPVQGALVTLSDPRSKEKWSVTTKADGRYNFDDLSFIVDYEVSAKTTKEVSAVKRLSQYERGPLLVRNLELAPATTPPPAAASATTPANPATPSTPKK